MRRLIPASRSMPAAHGAATHPRAAAAAKLFSKGAAWLGGVVSSTRSLMAGVSAASANTYSAYITPIIISPPNGRSRLAVAARSSAAMITRSGWFFSSRRLVMNMLATPLIAAIAKRIPIVLML